MVHNYIKGIKNYYNGSYPLAFFSYISGGFGKNINSQIQNIATETSVHGSAMSVSNMIKLVEEHSHSQYEHKKIRNTFSLDRQILLSDL